MLPFGDGISMLHYASAVGLGTGDSATASAVDDDDAQVGQKRRCVWTEDLHSRFESAVESLGLDHAKPMAILDHMGVKGLTKANIKSHLQKYRMKVQAAKGDVPSSQGLRELSASVRKPTSISLGPQPSSSSADTLASPDRGYSATHPSDARPRVSSGACQNGGGGGVGMGNGGRLVEVVSDGSSGPRSDYGPACQPRVAALQLTERALPTASTPEGFHVDVAAEARHALGLGGGGLGGARGGEMHRRLVDSMRQHGLTLIAQLELQEELARQLTYQRGLQSEMETMLATHLEAMRGVQPQMQHELRGKVQLQHELQTRSQSACHELQVHLRMQQQILADLNNAGFLPEGAGIAAAGNTLSQVSALANAYAGAGSLGASRPLEEAYPMSDAGRLPEAARLPHGAPPAGVSHGPMSGSPHTQQHTQQQQQPPPQQQQQFGQQQQQQQQFGQQPPPQQQQQFEQQQQQQFEQQQQGLSHVGGGTAAALPAAEMWMRSLSNLGMMGVPEAQVGAAANGANNGGGGGGGDVGGGDVGGGGGASLSSLASLGGLGAVSAMGAMANAMGGAALAALSNGSDAAHEAASGGAPSSVYGGRSERSSAVSSQGVERSASEERSAPSEANTMVPHLVSLEVAHLAPGVRARAGADYELGRGLSASTLSSSALSHGRSSAPPYPAASTNSNNSSQDAGSFSQGSSANEGAVAANAVAQGVAWEAAAALLHARGAATSARAITEAEAEVTAAEAEAKAEAAAVGERDAADDGGGNDEAEDDGMDPAAVD